MRTYMYGNKYHSIAKRLLQETSYPIAHGSDWSKMECRLNALEAIEFAVESWKVLVGYSFEVSGSRVR